MKNYTFSFLDYKLVSVAFSLTGKTPKDVDINPRFEVSHEKEKDKLKVYLALVSEDGGSPFLFNVKIAGLFGFDRDISQDNMEDIANINCAAILFPFLRETLADLTRRSGLPPLLLPPINFVALAADLKKKANE